MNIKARIEHTNIARRMINERGYRAVTFAVGSLIFNLMFAVYNGILGVLNHSLWFGATCVYYLLLIAMRFTAVLGSRQRSLLRECAVMRTSGILLIITGILMGFILYISLEQNTATAHGEIIMITIATYTFTKLIFAVIRAVKNRASNAPVQRTIYTIGYTDIAVSLLSMQQSMLVSFGAMTPIKIYVLNIFTGVCVSLFIVILGIFSVKGAKQNGKIENSKSK